MIFIVGLALLFGIIIAKMIAKAIPLFTHLPVVGSVIGWFANTWWLIPVATFLTIFGLTRRLGFSLIVTATVAVLSYLTGGFV